MVVTEPSEKRRAAVEGPEKVPARCLGPTETQDLIYLAGPLTEDALLKCLHARFTAEQYFVSYQWGMSNGLQVSA